MTKIQNTHPLPHWLCVPRLASFQQGLFCLTILARHTNGPNGNFRELRPQFPAVTASSCHLQGRVAVVMYRYHDATTGDNPLGVDTFVITGAWSAGAVWVVMCGGKQDTRP